MRVFNHHHRHAVLGEHFHLRHGEVNGNHNQAVEVAGDGQPLQVAVQAPLGIDRVNHHLVAGLLQCGGNPPQALGEGRLGKKGRQHANPAGILQCPGARFRLGNKTERINGSLDGFQRLLVDPLGLVENARDSGDADACQPGYIVDGGLFSGHCASRMGWKAVFMKALRNGYTFFPPGRQAIGRMNARAAQ